MTRPTRRALLAASLLPLAARGATVPVVAAAADLADVLPRVIASFQGTTGRQVKAAFGASGNLTNQIRNGAPFELFMSADESFVDTLAKEGRTDGPGTLYAIGHLVLFVPAGSPLKPDGTLDDLRAALGDGRLGKFAIANPEFAPYGRAARSALQHAGLWDAIGPHFVLGENVSQAAQFAASGNTSGGLIPLTLAKTLPNGSFGAVPDNYYPPLRQKMALLKNAGPQAQAFYAFLQSPPARAEFKAAGFLLPGEEG